MCQLRLQKESVVNKKYSSILRIIRVELVFVSLCPLPYLDPAVPLIVNPKLTARASEVYFSDKSALTRGGLLNHNITC